MKKPIALIATLALLAAAPAPTAAPKPYVPPPPPDAISQHTVQVGGQTIAYTARAGNITLRNDKDQVTAHMFYVAYTKNGADASSRPVTFFYNGGPGSSTVWLHMGSFAPVHVVVPNGHGAPPAPYKFVANPYSLIDKSDLVFIDAPNTGYSRVLGYGDPKDFMGVDQDGRAFTQFIQRYITQFNRWYSPKFLFGESYGTTRDAVLSSDLEDAGIQMSGIVFLSSILNFGLGGGIAGGDWSYVLYLPTMAATAWYHNVVPHRGDFWSFLKRVEDFAGTRYLQDLAQGDTLSSSEREYVVRTMHDDIGLSTEFIRDSNLRVPYSRFLKELLRTQNIILGRYDGRYETYSIDPSGDTPDWDPSDIGMSGAFVASFNRYIHEGLHYNSNLQYRPTAYGGELGAEWDMHHNGSVPTNVVPDLATALSENPHLQLFSANGYYDFATPFFATVYTFNHLNVAPVLYKNVTYGFYQSGHMVYLNQNQAAAFKADLSRWYDRVTSRR